MKNDHPLIGEIKEQEAIAAKIHSHLVELTKMLHLARKKNLSVYLKNADGYSGVNGGHVTAGISAKITFIDGKTVIE